MRGLKSERDSLLAALLETRDPVHERRLIEQLVGMRMSEAEAAEAADSIRREAAKAAEALRPVPAPVPMFVPAPVPDQPPECTPSERERARVMFVGSNAR
jgi:hypothetical protein